MNRWGQVKNMGGLGKILEMMPGLTPAQMKGVDLEQSEKEFAHMEAIICSMTIEERQDPSILNASRRKTHCGRMRPAR